MGRPAPGLRTPPDGPRPAAARADHPGTLVGRHEVAAARVRALGPDHPGTLASRDDEAHCLEQLGRGPEALELCRRVAVIRRAGAG